MNPFTCDCAPCGATRERYHQARALLISGETVSTREGREIALEFLLAVQRRVVIETTIEQLRATQAVHSHTGA